MAPPSTLFLVPVIIMFSPSSSTNNALLPIAIFPIPYVSAFKAVAPIAIVPSASAVIIPLSADVPIAIA